MAGELSGRRVVVTGGASGMGAGVVQAFAARGARVVSLDRDPAGEQVAADAGAVFLLCDVADEGSVGGAVDGAADALGGLDVLVHAAGIAPGAAAEHTELALWQDALAVNATGTFLTNRAVLPHLRASGGGRIVNFASGAGVAGYPGKAAYAASKGAVLAWTRTVAVEWAPYGITVNALAPAIRTPMYEATRDAMSAAQLAAHDAALLERIPLGGRLGDMGRDLVPVLVFLAGDGARFMTGQVFAVDGGMLMVR